MADLVERQIRKERLQRKEIFLHGIFILHAIVLTLVFSLHSRQEPMIDYYPEDCSFTVYQVPLRNYFSQKALRVAFSPTMNETKEAKFYDTEHSRWSVVKPYEQELYREIITAFMHQKVTTEGVERQYIWSQPWNPKVLCISQARTQVNNNCYVRGTYNKITIHEEVQHDDEITFQDEVQKIVHKAWGHIKAFGDFYAAHTNNLLEEFKAKFIA